MIFAPIALSAFILFFLIYPKYDKIVSVLRTARFDYLFYSLFFANLSYFLMGLSLWETLKIMRYKISVSSAWAISLVSTSVNYFLSTGGVSGFAVRAHLLAKRKVPYSICITSSVVLTVFIYLVLDLIILQGFIHQFLKTRDLTNQLVEGFIGAIILLGVSMFFVSMLYHHHFRSTWAKRIYHMVNHVVYFFSKKEIPREDFNLFESQLNEGITRLHEKKYELPKVVGYVTLDWIANILALYFAFKAIGVNISFSKLIVGFSFGMIMTVIPILPGGLGAMEAAMAAAYAGMGIPWESGIVAALIFRVFYYIIPALTSMFVYLGLKMSEPGYHYENLEKKLLKKSHHPGGTDYDI